MKWHSSKWCHPDSPSLKKLHQVSNRVKATLITDHNNNAVILHHSLQGLHCECRILLKVFGEWPTYSSARNASSFHCRCSNACAVQHTLLGGKTNERTSGPVAMENSRTFSLILQIRGSVTLICFWSWRNPTEAAVWNSGRDNTCRRTVRHRHQNWSVDGIWWLPEMWDKVNTQKGITMMAHNDSFQQEGGPLCRHHTFCDYLSLNQCICIYFLQHSTRFHTTTPEKQVVFLKTYCCLCELCWALGATNDQVLQVLWILSPPCTRWVSWTGSLWVLRWASKWEPTHLSGRQTGGRKRGWTNSLRTLHQEINQLY